MYYYSETDWNADFKHSLYFYTYKWHLPVRQKGLGNILYFKYFQDTKGDNKKVWGQSSNDKSDFQPEISVSPRAGWKHDSISIHSETLNLNKELFDLQCSRDSKCR